MSPPDPVVSLVIPTRNGSDTLPITLRGVADQSYPRDRLELIVVDDGSSDGALDQVTDLPGASVIRLRQEPAGAAAARNRGASQARGSILVFLDDDIELSPGAIGALVAVHRSSPRAIVVGWLEPPPPSNAFERLQVIRPARATAEEISVIPFTDCFTGLLSVGASDFTACGSFQDPTGGTPSWDDIDFGYRAQKLGFPLLRAATARAVHHDRSSADLESLCRRWHAASISAVRLFQRHPGIESELPMYSDKFPVDWRRDSWRLVARKLLRSAASRPVTHVWIRRAARALGSSGRLPALARPLCGLAISGAIWQGLRDGIARPGGPPSPEVRTG